jgi:hypothetical protein
MHAVLNPVDKGKLPGPPFELPDAEGGKDGDPQERKEYETCEAASR